MFTVCYHLSLDLFKIDGFLARNINIYQKIFVSVKILKFKPNLILVYGKFWLQAVTNYFENLPNTPILGLGELKLLFWHDNYEDLVWITFPSEPCCNSSSGTAESMISFHDKTHRVVYKIQRQTRILETRTESMCKKCPTNTYVVY